MDTQQESKEGTQQKASPVDQGIVSVNRHVSGMNQTARISVLIVMAIVVVLGLVFTANTLNATRKAEATKEEQAMKVENKPAQVGLRRVFETDPLPPQQTAALRSTGTSPVSSTNHAMRSPPDRGLDDGNRPMAPDRHKATHHSADTLPVGSVETSL